MTVVTRDPHPIILVGRHCNAAAVVGLRRVAAGSAGHPVTILVPSAVMTEAFVTV